MFMNSNSLEIDTNFNKIEVCSKCSNLICSIFSGGIWDVQKNFLSTFQPASMHIMFPILVLEHLLLFKCPQHEFQNDMIVLKLPTYL